MLASGQNAEDDDHKEEAAATEEQNEPVAAIERGSGPKNEVKQDLAAE